MFQFDQYISSLSNAIFRIFINNILIKNGELPSHKRSHYIIIESYCEAAHRFTKYWPFLSRILNLIKGAAHRTSC